VGRVFKNKIVKFIFVIAAIASVGCSKEGDGFAPGVGAEDGGATTTTPPSSNEMTDSQMKIGSQVTSGNGWTINADHADPVQSTAATNGWTVEVKYE